MWSREGMVMETYFVKIRCANDERWRELQQHADLDLFRQTAKRLPGREIEVDGLFTDVQIAQLRARGYTVEIVADAQQIARARQQEIGHDDSTAEDTNDHTG
jgi:hypothetical protein